MATFVLTYLISIAFRSDDFPDCLPLMMIGDDARHDSDGGGLEDDDVDGTIDNDGSNDDEGWGDDYYNDDR